MKILGIDPGMAETRMAIVINNHIKEVQKIFPPSSMLYNPTDQLCVIMTNLNREFLNETNYVSVIKRPHTEDIMKSITELCDNYKISLTSVTQIQTKEALGLKKMHAPIRMYQEIIEQFNDASNILTGSYAVGAAIHVLNTLK